QQPQQRALQQPPPQQMQVGQSGQFVQPPLAQPQIPPTTMPNNLPYPKEQYKQALQIITTNHQIGPPLLQKHGQNVVLAATDFIQSGGLSLFTSKQAQFQQFQQQQQQQQHQQALQQPPPPLPQQQQQQQQQRPPIGVGVNGQMVRPPLQQQFQQPPQQPLHQQQQQQQQQQMQQQQQQQLQQQRLTSANLMSQQAGMADMSAEGSLDQKQIDQLKMMYNQRLRTVGAFVGNQVPAQQPTASPQNRSQQFSSPAIPFNQLQPPQPISQQPPPQQHQQQQQQQQFQQQQPPQQQQQQQQALLLQQQQQQAMAAGGLTPAVMAGLPDEQVSRLLMGTASKLFNDLKTGTAVSQESKARLQMTLNETQRRGLSIPPALQNLLSRMSPASNNAIPNLVFGQDSQQQPQHQQLPQQTFQPNPAAGTSVQPIDLTGSTPYLTQTPQLAQASAAFTTPLQPAAQIKPPTPQGPPQQIAAVAAQAQQQLQAHALQQQQKRDQQQRDFLTTQQQQQKNATDQANLLLQQKVAAARQLQSQQQQQQQQWNQNQPQVQVPPPVPQAPPWAGIDFSKEPVLQESIVMEMIKKFMGTNPYPVIIQGREVYLHGLYCLVHSVGGSHKLNKMDLSGWAVVAARMGWKTETQSKSSEQVAMELRQVYATYISQIETVWYNSLYPKYQSQNQNQNNQNQNQSQNPNQPLQPSNTFVDAVAMGNNKVIMSEEQRRLVESRRLGQPQQSQQPAPAVQQPPPPQQQQPGSSPAQAPPLPGVNGQKADPKVVLQHIKVKEADFKRKFPNRSLEIPPDRKMAYLTLLKSLAPLAEDLQKKTPYFFMLASQEDLVVGSQIIYTYVFIKIAAGMAERGQFALERKEVESFGNSVRNVMPKVHAVLERMNTPDGQAALKRIQSTIESAKTQTPPMQAQTPNVNATSSPSRKVELPQGLRVEDLKPPPSKRQKTKSSSTTNVPSPLAHQIDEPKTPVDPKKTAAPVSAIAGSGGGSRGVKRKLSSWSSKEKDGEGNDEDGNNALGIDLSAVGVAVGSRDSEFFTSRKQDYIKDPLESMFSALEEFKQIQPPSNAAEGGAGDDIFDTFLDSAVYADEISGAPTPDLMIPQLGVDDTPDSNLAVSPVNNRLFPGLSAEDDKDTDGQTDKDVVHMGSPISGFYNGFIGASWFGEDLETVNVV
ncbi:hypothetical protein P7C73_g3288, partial [Tremellales sp. Uapishka_1]